jgi:hypothetical protein
MRNWGRSLSTRDKIPVETPLGVPAYQTLYLVRPPLKFGFCCVSCF